MRAYPQQKYILVDHAEPRERPTHPFIKADLMDHSSLTKAAARLSEPIDGVLLSPYFNPKKRFDDMCDEEFMQALLMKSMGYARLVRALLGNLGTAASVVFVGSTHGQRASVGNSAYAMSNAAIEALTRALAVEYKRKFRFNTIVMGGTLTEAYKQEHPDTWEKRVSLGQLLTPLQVINVAHFLLSPLSSGINGQSIVVDGGVSCQRISSSSW